MVGKYCLIILFLSSMHLQADPPKKEISLFLEYEREASQQANVFSDEENPFKKIIHTITPTKPKTPFVNVPVLPVVAKSTLPQSNKPSIKPLIGQDDLPYLVIKNPISPVIEPAKSCPDPIVLTIESQTVEKPKKSLFSNLSSAKERVLTRAKEFLGTPYGFGSKESVQTDCSGFTQQVFKQFGVSLPRSAAEQARYGKHVDSNDLQVGDLLFYQTYKSEPSHVAIYAGEGQIIHASYKNRRVQYDAMDKGYYKQRFLYAKRLDIGEQDTSNE